jgi:hypothetical protein
VARAERVGDLLGGHPQQAQEPVQDRCRIGRWLGRVGVEAAQVDEEHPVDRFLADQPVPGVDGELGLADPGHPLDRGDHHRVTGLGGLLELVEFEDAAGEPGQVRG